MIAGEHMLPENRAQEYIEYLEGKLKGHEWKPISTAPRDGTVFMMRKTHPEITNYYSAWYMKPEKSFDGEVEEWDGHMWILNDDEKQLVVEEDDYGYEWKPEDKS